MSIGINAAPLVGGLAILAGVLRARESGEGCEMELGQSDAAAYFDWYRSESHMAYARPEKEVTGNKADAYKRRPVATAGMRYGVRYQLYESSDGHALFMASEQASGKTSAPALNVLDAVHQWPGSNMPTMPRVIAGLQAELRAIFKTRT